MRLRRNSQKNRKAKREQSLGYLKKKVFYERRCNHKGQRPLRLANIGKKIRKLIGKKINHPRQSC